MKLEKNTKKIKKNKLTKISLSAYKFLPIILLLLFFIFCRPQPTGFLVNLLDELKFCLGTIIWVSLGVLVGGLLLVLFRNKEQLIT